ncbi:MAG: response regulator [Pseudomonadota bacterium]
MNHVLIVEDDRTHRAMTQEILTDLGFKVTTADNGFTALSKISSNPQGFACILMDWEMPEMDGLETVRSIRANQVEDGWPYIPIIAFTSNKQPGDEEQCLAAGMDGYLSKDLFFPKWRKELQQKLSGWIESHDS